MINHRYPVPFVVLSGDVIDASSTKLQYSDLQDLYGSVNVGIYDADTYHIATGSGLGEKFFIGYSSEHSKDFLDKFIFGATLPKGSSFWEFKGKDVLSFEYSEPTRMTNERWVLGWSGADGCDLTLPKFECGKPYGIRIALTGNEVFKRWAGKLQHEIFSDPVCCNETNCSDGCNDQNIDCEKIMKDIATKINNHVELKTMGVRARFISNKYAAHVVNMHKYQIVVTDDGSSSAQARIQQTTPYKVELVNRMGLQSVYEVCSDVAPANFTPDNVVALTQTCANCPTCPQGSTTIPAYDVYSVIRPISENTALATQAQKDAFAVTVAGDYSGSNPVFLNQNTAGAVIEFSLTKGATTPVAVKSDILIFVRTTSVLCTLPPSSPISWSQVCDAYRVERTLCITLRRKDCPTGDRLAELQAYYKDWKNIVPNSIVKVAIVEGQVQDCEDVYNIRQVSSCMEDSCLAYDIAQFEDLGSYDGQLWVEQAVSPTFDDTKKCGLEISAKLPQKFLSDCEFELEDNLVLEPITMEVSWIYDSYTGFPSACNFAFDNTKRVQTSTSERQSGYATLLEYIKAGAYEVFAQDYHSPRLRRIFDSNRRKQVDRNTPYRYYYLQFKVARTDHNFDQVPEVAEAVFAVPYNRPDKMLKLERAILSPLSKFGVTLKKRQDGIKGGYNPGIY